MEVPAGQDGIQRLLAAEQEAQAVVAEARKAKSERLKQAKAEADVEISAYKKEREAEYQRRVADGSDSNVATVGKLEAESKASVDAIAKATTDKREDVLSFLIDRVTTVAY